MSTIVGLILLVGGITLYKTFALYEEKKEFNVLRGKIPNFLNGDIELAVIIDGEKTNNFPPKDSVYLVEKIECDNNAVGKWNYATWSINIGNLSVSKTTCTISFKSDLIAKLKNIIGSTSEATTMDEVLANSTDVNKIIASKEAMNFIIENPSLKDAIKESSNYTTAVAKRFLASTVVSEEEKYNAGLPCYIFEPSINAKILGDFIVKTNSTSSSSTGTLVGTSHYNVNTYSDAGKKADVTIVSSKKIQIKNYNTLEIHYDHGTNSTSTITLVGTNALGISDNQNINSFTLSKSSTTPGNGVFLTVDISTAIEDSYIKFNLKNNAQKEGNVYTNIYSLALY